MPENRSKSARVRAIRDRARTQRVPESAQIGRIGQNLSGRDFARSVDHRRRFAWGRNARLPASALPISRSTRNPPVLVSTALREPIRTGARGVRPGSRGEFGVSTAFAATAGAMTWLRALSSGGIAYAGSVLVNAMGRRPRRGRRRSRNS